MRRAKYWLRYALAWTLATVLLAAALTLLKLLGEEFGSAAEFARRLAAQYTLYLTTAGAGLHWCVGMTVFSAGFSVMVSMGAARRAVIRSAWAAHGIWTLCLVLLSVALRGLTGPAGGPGPLLSAGILLLAASFGLLDSALLTRWQGRFQWIVVLGTAAAAAFAGFALCWFVYLPCQDGRLPVSMTGLQILAAAGAGVLYLASGILAWMTVRNAEVRF